MTTDNPTAVPSRAGAKKGAAPRRGQQSSFRARKRRRNQLLAGGTIGLVVIVVAVVVAITRSGSGGGGATAVPQATLASIQSVTPAQMAAAESGLKVANPPIAITGDPALTSGGLPEVLYIGAEYCPYCAGERWSLVQALSQFGTWSNLHSITSSSTDTVASIPTFSFVGSTFTSNLVSFSSVEEQTVDQKPLQKPTAEQDALISKYDAPPYASAASAGGIPFIDLGNSSVQDGLGFALSADQAMQHQKFSEIAKQVATQSSPVAGNIAAEAGVLVSNICKLTGGKDAVGGAACKAFPAPITQPPAGSHS